MCGLAGIARKPDAPNLDVAKLMLCDLLQSMEKRGRHATGIGVCGGSDPFIWKWAMPATTVLKSKKWGEVLESISPDTRAVIGHTRHSTHNNSAKDEAAHPFQEGRVVGAHNGIIYNWISLEKKLQRKKDSPQWIVDSQAAFGVLDRYKKPEQALASLEGYFALSWWKGDNLFLARTPDAPLVCAYVPIMKTMFWCSEEYPLHNVMLQAGLKKDHYSLWRLNAGEVYKYDTDKFTAETNPEKVGFSLKKTEKVKIHKAHQSNLSDRSMGGRTTTASAALTRGGWQAGDYGDSYWDSTRGKEVFKSPADRVLASVRGSSAQVSLLDLQKRLDLLEDQIDTLKAENTYIYSLLDDFGLMDGEEEEEDVVLEELGSTQATEVPAFPKDPLASFDTLFEDRLQAEFFHTCKECNGGRGVSGKGSLLRLPDDKYVHEKCIFPTDIPSEHMA